MTPATATTMDAIPAQLVAESSTSSLPNTRVPSPEPSRPLRRPASHGRLGKLMAGRDRSSSTASQPASPVIAYAEDDQGGRTTPEQRRRTGRAAAASLLASDPKYKKFSIQVDKVLHSFDHVNEWADIISFLSRLLKTLQTPSPPYGEIPRKLILAKRLAQCLNPALPTGVHQRALDVYSYIFSIIGVDGLKRDLLIWSSGLFPFFQFAATSARPALIAIYETYYLPLKEDLRPATKALILALLPGVEEETGDFFDRVLLLLNRLSDAVSPSFFMQNIYLVLISASSARLSALNYLARKQDPSTETGIMIRGVAAVLDDPNVLVRRGGLDLLLRSLTLSGPVWSDASESDQELLVRTACSVVLQRELSLSRRIYTWLLGPEDVSEKQTAFFVKHGLDILAKTLQADMRGPTEETQRPFKIFLSLLDKSDIGMPLSERMILQTLQAVKDLGGSQELLITVSAIYEAVEPSVTWKLLCSAVSAQLMDDDGDAMSLVQWILTNISQHDEEVLFTHIPTLLLAVLDSVEDSDVKLHKLEALKLAISLLRALPSTSFTSMMNSDRQHRTVTSAFRIARLSGAGYESRLAAVQIVSLLIDNEATALEKIDGQTWVQELLRDVHEIPSFVIVDAIVGTVFKAGRCPAFEPSIDVTVDGVMLPVLDSLFHYLRPDAAAYHVRAVELLWEYNQLAEIHTLENVIARRLSSDKTKIEAFEAFGTLWRLTDESMLPGEIFNVPIFMVLDSLNSPNPDFQRLADTWIRCNVRSYFSILEPILTRLLLPVDSWRSVEYLLRSISSLFKFAGQGLSKACQSMEMHRSQHSTFLQRAEQAFPNAASYLELLVGLLERLFQQAPGHQAEGLKVQSSVIDILQTLVSFGDVAKSSVSSLKTILIAQLTSAVTSRRLTHQNKMLRLLHSAISTSEQRGHRRSLSNPDRGVEEKTDLEQGLVPMIICGVSAASNRPVLQHWVDFVLMTVPMFQHRMSVLQTLSECFNQQLRLTMLEIRMVYSHLSIVDRSATVSDAEPVMLLNALERIVSLLAGRTSSRISEDGGRPTTEGGSGILGYMTNVFTADAQPTAAVEPNHRFMDDTVDALLLAWTITEDSTQLGAIQASRSHNFSRTRNRLRKVLDKFFKTHSLEVIESCVQVWSCSSSDISDDAIFNCIDVLTPSAQRVVSILCDIAGRSIKTVGTDRRSDPVLAFLEAYISRLEAPIAVQIWNVLFGFAKDVLGYGAPSRMQLWPILRCLTVLSQTVASTSALEDKRLRRDLQDTYVKVLDAVLGNAVRIAESVPWHRATDETTPPPSETIYLFISSSVIPNLRSFLNDPDKVASACTLIAINLIVPAFRQQKVDSTTLLLLIELTKLPSAVRAWRNQVGDAFNDGRFFKAPPEDSQYWKPLICCLMDSDRDRINELLGRIATAPSANIFTNREQEMISRSLNLRRLSFVLLAADRNHFLTQLPSIQEKLVEILRTNVVSPRVHSEVYLCLRVLMCRISPQHLTNFWPVILAELLRVFESTMDEPPPDDSEQLQLVLAACKFLDLLLAIQSEDFQIHQWMFVTDTTDAAYPPEDYNPESIMDRLSEIMSEHSRDAEILSIPDTQDSSSLLRRPRLSSLKTLTSLYQLQSFFARASIDTFEGVYSNAGVDWDAIEEGLNGEIFDSGI